MKKLIGTLSFVVIMLSMIITVLAGSIPEDLLHSDGAQIFFGEVLSYSDENSTVTVCPVKKVKGEVQTGTKQQYERANTIGDFKVRAGNVYLFTYFDDNNPTEIFEVTGYDTASLKIKNTTGDMWKRFEKYLNDGEYEKAEKERINQINARLTEVGEMITLSALTETDNENCYKVTMGLFGTAQEYEVDKGEFYKLADRIRLVDVENVLVTDADDGLVIRCYMDADPGEITIWDNCTVSGSRVAMFSAPTGDYVIKAEDFNALLSLLPEDAQPKLPPMKSLYANFYYWFIYNAKTAYAVGAAALLVLLWVLGGIIRRKSKKKVG